MNTEGAAKMVDCLREQAALYHWMETRHKNLIAAANWIERHATPQTHGEGEAVGYVDRTGLEMFRAGTLETLLMHRQKRRVDYAPLYTHPAPSPTAAPALGDKELCALIKGLSEGADLIDEIPIIIGPAISDYMRQAASALQEKQ